jgi:hypothetical protein
MSQKVIDIIKYGSESHSVDFKREQYPIEKHAKKHELLKDISAMANHPSDEDKYIIIGIKEKNGKGSDLYSISEIVDQSKYQQYIDSNIEPKIKFEYKSLMYKNNQIAYFRIYGNKDRPYLFKKVVQNSIDKNKVDFKEGDGFIRVGTSTRKMTRSDFDFIYNSKHVPKDRKDELKIEAYWKIIDDDYYKGINLKYFDLSIDNTSNQSIEFDIEMTVFHGKGFKIVPEHELRKKFEESRESTQNPYDIFKPNLTGIMASNLNFIIDEKEEYVLIKPRGLINRKFDFCLPQESVESDIFQQELVIMELDPEQRKTDIIFAEVTIRSDDFSEGLLKKKFEIKFEK